MSAFATYLPGTGHRNSRRRPAIGPSRIDRGPLTYRHGIVP